MEKIDFNTGPFGSYERGTTGHVMNSLHDMGIPITTIERCTFVGNGLLVCDGKNFATYKYFDGIEQPLFRFEKQDIYPGLIFSGSSKGGQEITTPKFRLSLSVNGTPGIIVSGINATNNVHRAIQESLTNWTPDPAYDIHQDAGAFFQGGHGSPEGQWFFVEFWKPAGAEAYAEHLSKIYAKILQQNIPGVKIGNTPFTELDKMIESFK